MEREMKTIAEQMAEQLRLRGWGKGWAENPSTKKVCMSGAAFKLPISYEAFTETAEDLLPVIRELFPGRSECTPGCDAGNFGSSRTATLWHKVVHFNDHPDTTEEDVFLVLKHAAG
jgi:hypothetical protein